MAQEIERKFLLSAIPLDKTFSAHRKAETVYLSVERDSEKNISSEIRLRRVYELDGHYMDYITYKSGGMLSRFEAETRCETDFASSVFEKNDISPIIYDCYNFPFGNYEIELAQVDNDFVYAEVEFPTEEEANDFIWPWPEYLIEEITYNKDYKMANYWVDTRY